MKQNFKPIETGLFLFAILASVMLQIEFSFFFNRLSIDIKNTETFLVYQSTQNKVNYNIPLINLVFSQFTIDYNTYLQIISLIIILGGMTIAYLKTGKVNYAFAWACCPMAFMLGIWHFPQFIMTLFIGLALGELIFIIPAFFSHRLGFMAIFALLIASFIELKWAKTLFMILWILIPIIFFSFFQFSLLTNQFQYSLFLHYIIGTPLIWWAKAESKLWLLCLLILIGGIFLELFMEYYTITRCCLSILILILLFAEHTDFELAIMAFFGLNSWIAVFSLKASLFITLFILLAVAGKEIKNMVENLIKIDKFVMSKR